MDPHEYLSDDGHAMLALCSAFGLPEDNAAAGLSPFTLSEWNQLAKQMQGSSLKRPADLQGRTANEISKGLGLPGDEADRIVRLLDRAGDLALQLDVLFSRGMWAMTRLDERYPARMRDTLKHQAPTVLFGAGEIQLLARRGVAVIGSRNIDEAGTAFARQVGVMASSANLAVVSGGARGTDRLRQYTTAECVGCHSGCKIRNRKFRHGTAARLTFSRSDLRAATASPESAKHTHTPPV